MTERAQVTSVEAIEAFRAKLIVYMSKARAVLEEAGDEVLQTRGWLENDQRAHWDLECRRRRRALDEAQQELFSAKLSRLQTQSAAQLLAVERAKEGLRRAEEQRECVKRWTRQFENRAEPLAKQVEQLLTFVSTELPKAAAHLGSLVKTLDAYAAIAPDLALMGGASGSAPVKSGDGMQAEVLDPPKPEPQHDRDGRLP